MNESKIFLTPADIDKLGEAIDTEILEIYKDKDFTTAAYDYLDMVQIGEFAAFYALNMACEKLNNQRKKSGKYQLTFNDDKELIAAIAAYYNQTH